LKCIELTKFRSGADSCVVFIVQPIAPVYKNLCTNPTSIALWLERTSVCRYNLF